MTLLTSLIDRNGAVFRANDAHNRDLADELRGKIAAAALGGPQASRQRHTARGKLLPRERVSGCWIPARRSWRSARWPPTGSMTARRPAPGLIAGIGRVSGREVMIVANDATVKGGAYFPLTVKKHLRAQEIAPAEPAAVHLSGRYRRRQPAASGRSVSRPRSFRPHLLQPGADDGAGHRPDRLRDGLLHRRRRLCAGHVRRDHHRAQARGPSSWPARRW